MVTSSVVTGSVLDNITHVRGATTSNGSLTETLYTVPANRFALVQFYTISATGVASGSASMDLLNELDENMVSIVSVGASATSSASQMFWSGLDDTAGTGGRSEMLMDEDWELRASAAGAGGPSSSISYRFLVMEYIK